MIGKDGWGANKRHYETISEAPMPEIEPLLGPKKLLIGPSTEAFTVLLYENCREKWIAMYILKKKHYHRATGGWYMKYLINLVLKVWST